MRILFFGLALTILSGMLLAFSTAPSRAMMNGDDLVEQQPQNYPVAYFAGGCFWCIESEFRALDGVLYTRAGYLGGALDNPSYEDVTTGKTGHAEAVEITFDPAQTSYEMLVEFFLTKGHDPTQLNRQGPDAGPQYRSAIFPADTAQERIAKDMIKRIDMNMIYAEKIVTTIEPLVHFWEAEPHHQQYYEKYEEEHGQPHLRVFLKKGKKR